MPGSTRETARSERSQFSILYHQGVCFYKMTWGNERLNVQMMVWFAAKMSALAAKADIYQRRDAGWWYFESLVEESMQMPQCNNQTRIIKLKSGNIFCLKVTFVCIHNCRAGNIVELSMPSHVHMYGTQSI